MNNKFLFIFLLTVVLSLGILTGNSLACSCSIQHSHTSSKCPTSGTANCCTCGHYSSTCLTCSSGQYCHDGQYSSGTCGGTTYMNYWGGATCESSS